MKAAVLIIGDEILLGRVTDTNSGFMARTLEPQGISVEHIETVGDNGEDILRAVERLTAEYPIVLSTGGLGPTKDDITKGVLCQVFGGELREDAQVLENVEGIFARRGLKMNRLTRTQALVPTSCRVIQNELGTAPIMWFEHSGGVLVAMPGVPFETEGMLTRAVAPQLIEKFVPGVHTAHRTLMVWNITESDLAQRLEPLEDKLPEHLHLAYLPDSPVIRLRVDGRGTDAAKVERDVEKLHARLCRELKDVLISDKDSDVAQVVLDRLGELGWTLGTAESCTGGNIARMITARPGSSSVFVGSVVSYANEVKHNVLSVPMEALETHGAVSEPVVRAMASGAAQTLGADCTVSTSGIAGPGGGTEQKPVGTVWIAAHTPKQGTQARLYHFTGSRERIIRRASYTALLMLFDLTCQK